LRTFGVLIIMGLMFVLGWQQGERRKEKTGGKEQDKAFQARDQAANPNASQVQELKRFGEIFRQTTGLEKFTAMTGMLNALIIINKFQAEPEPTFYLYDGGDEKNGANITEKEILALLGPPDTRASDAAEWINSPGIGEVIKRHKEARFQNLFYWTGSYGFGGYMVNFFIFDGILRGAFVSGAFS